MKIPAANRGESFPEETTMKKFVLIAWSLVFGAISIQARRSDFPKLTGPYLGQKPPGITPEHFGVGVIDNDERVFAITFSPDGKECFYTKSLTTNTIMTAKEINGRWSEPAIAEFSGKDFDFEPHITPDGMKMIFGSRRPLPSMNKQGEIPQWVIEKKDDGWSEPKPLGPPFSNGFCMYVSVANNGNIYFTGKDGIYRSAFLNGKHSTPEKLGQVINDLQYAAHPFIAPDESYLIFDAQPQEGNAELFISFRDEDKNWSKPQRFDSDFNTDQNELAAFVTRDGKHLFFSRLSPGKGDIYWVSANIIEELKPTAGASLAQFRESPERQAPKLSEKLPIFKPFIGPTWVGSIPNDSRMGEITLKWEIVLNGFAVRLKRNILSSDHWLETTYYWDEASGKIAYLAISNNGFVSKGFVAGQGEELISEGEQRGPGVNRKVRRIYRLEKDDKLSEDDQFRNSDTDEWRRTHVSVFVAK